MNSCVGIVIPAFNEARTIRSIAQRALAQCDMVIVIDDGSTDGTAAAISDLPVVLLLQPHNCGKAASLWRGFSEALARGAEVVVTLDADGQHLPEEVPRMLSAASAHPDSIVIGARLRHRSRAPRIRRFANRFADFWLSWACGQRVVDSQSGQRAYPASLLARFDLPHEDKARFTLESEILIEAAQLGYRWVAVPIDAIYDAGGRRSHFRPVRDIAHIAAMVARRLLAQRLSPRGLWRSLRVPAVVLESAASAEYNRWRYPDRDRSSPAVAAPASPID